MRDLTEEELAQATNGCDYYNIIDGKVYFTDVLGIDVFDIDGNEIDNCIMDNKTFVKSRPLPEKPFDISEYKFTDGDIDFIFENGRFLIEIDSDRSIYGEIKKPDAIAIAKALGATAGDFK